MKLKHFIASLGTLALAANFLVPGVALAALTGTQTIGQDIDCPAGTTFEITDTPDAVSMDQLNVSASGQNSFDAALNDDASIAAVNEIRITDTRGGGFANCPTSTPGFTVTADISTTLLDTINSVETIGDGFFFIITSNEFTADPAGTTIADGEEVFYSFLDDDANLHDVDAPFIYDDRFRINATIFDRFNTVTSYKNFCGPADTEGSCTGALFSNRLNAARTILSTTTGHNGFIATGTAIYGSIPGGQGGGDYAGIITYTLAAQ